MFNKKAEYLIELDTKYKQSDSIATKNNLGRCQEGIVVPDMIQVTYLGNETIIKALFLKMKVA